MYQCPECNLRERMTELEGLYDKLLEGLETLLIERLTAHRIMISDLEELYGDEARQIRLMDLLDIDNRMKELENKYDGLMAHMGNTLPIIRSIEKSQSKLKGRF